MDPHRETEREALERRARVGALIKALEEELRTKSRSITHGRRKSRYGPQSGIFFPFTPRPPGRFTGRSAADGDTVIKREPTTE